MKFAIPITLVVLTVLLMVAGLVWTGHAGGTVGIAAGSAMYGLTPKADTPEHALANLLADAQRRNWDRAYADVSKTSDVDESSFIQDWDWLQRWPLARFRVWKVLTRGRCISLTTKRKCECVSTGPLRLAPSKTYAIFT